MRQTLTTEVVKAIISFVEEKFSNYIDRVLNGDEISLADAQKRYHQNEMERRQVQRALSSILNTKDKEKI